MRTNEGSSVLEWDLQDNPDYQRCITGYSISWNGGQYNTTDASTSVTREKLHQHGFPYCQTQTVTVSPLTLESRTIKEMKITNITLLKPGRYMGMTESSVCLNTIMLLFDRF